MPYARKTLTQLRSDILADINSAQITGSNGSILVALLQKAILRYIAYAQAGVGYEHYSELDYLSLQAVPWTAADEFLEGWASLRGIIREAATATIGTTTYAVTPGTTDIGIPAGTPVNRGDGVAYTTTAAAVQSGSSVTVTMQATAAGSAANFDAGTVFLLGAQIAGLQSQSTASAQVTAGTDQETDDSLRTRMLQAYAAPPQGGDMSDYVEWALAVPGVTRAWVAPNLLGAGTVSVYFMMDEAEAAHGGFPQGTTGVAANEPRDTAATGDPLTVANALFPKRPVTALVYAAIPADEPVNFTVADLGVNNTTAMQASIQEALADMFLRLGNVGGTVVPETGAAWPAIEPDDWYAALEAIPGLSGFKVTAPAAAITPGTGQLFTVGVVTPVT